VLRATAVAGGGGFREGGGRLQSGTTRALRQCLWGFSPAVVSGAAVGRRTLPGQAEREDMEASGGE
jgi:hypothetical protein